MPRAGWIIAAVAEHLRDGWPARSGGSRLLLAPQRRAAGQTADRGPVPGANGLRHLLLGLRVYTGNRAVSALLASPTGSPVVQRDAKAPCPPAGVTIAEPIPAKARSVPTGFDPKQPKVTTHGDGTSIPGGWPGLSKGSEKSFRVGKTDRILWTGVQIGNAGRAGGTPPSTRAVALVPDSVRAHPKGDVAVLVHLHGTEADKEMTDPNPIDTDEKRYDMVGQVEAFLADRPGARLIVLLPRGSTTYESVGAGDKKPTWVDFGGIDIPTFVSSAISQLQKSVFQVLRRAVSCCRGTALVAGSWR